MHHFDTCIQIHFHEPFYQLGEGEVVATMKMLENTLFLNFPTNG